MRPSFLDSMSWEMAEVYGALTDRILINMAKYFAFLKTGAELPKSFEYQARMLAQMGQVNRETAEIILQSMGGADDALRASLEAAIMDALKTEEPSLQKAARQGLINGPGFIPPEVSPNQMQAFQMYYQQSADKLNLVNTVMLESTQAAYTATVSDVVNRIQRTQSILNVGTGEVVTGVSSWNTAMHDAVQKMVKNGLTGFIDHGGHHWSPEVYVAMDIRTTMFNTAREAIKERAQEYGCDLYQVSSHNGARPLCYPWQAKVISRSDWTGIVEDLDGNKVRVYAQSETSYGQPAGLFGINCKHYPMTFIPGFSTLKGQPQDPEENEKAYAESQEQRRLERKLREEKRDLAVMKAQGASEEEIKAQQRRVKQASADIDQFCEDTGRARRRNREYTPVNASFEGADTSKQRPGRISGVIKDYKYHATPGIGEISYEPNFDQKGPRTDEISMAKYLQREYGGDITVRAERNQYKIGDPDYEWRGKLWDLKTPTSNKRVGDRVRDGLDQIKENTGGVIVDISNLTLTDEEAWRQIENRMRISLKATTDVMLFKNGSVIGIRRYIYK